jgi:hypothetical protein
MTTPSMGALELEKAIELALLVAHGDLSLAQSRLGTSQVGLCLGDLRLEEGGLDLRDQIVASDPAVEVRVEPMDPARDLAPHLDGDQRAERPGGRHAGDDLAPFDRRHGIPRQRRSGLAPPVGAHAPDQGDQNEQREERFGATRHPGRTYPSRRAFARTRLESSAADDTMRRSRNPSFGRPHTA